MTLQTCYEKLGGSYEEVFGRLHSERMIQKYVLKFLDDPSFSLLQSALNVEDQEEAFRAAHTLKGMCQTLGFAKLALSASEITELLRAGDFAAAKALFPRVCEDYNLTAAAIRAFQAEIGA